MWPGPYGEWGSRKYLLASLDQSLERLGLEYVDIFYSHRFDPDTPLEETMGALDTAVRQGKALYVGISSYSAEKTAEAAAILHDLGTPLLIHPALVLDAEPLDRARTARHAGRARCRLHHVLASGPGHADRQVPRRDPGGSRASRPSSLSPNLLTDETLAKIRALNDLAARRGQTLAQMALAWTLRDSRVTSTLVGASSVAQLEANVGALDKLDFTDEALAEIDRYATESEINIWSASSSE